jgi:hypothetical protein
MLATRVYEEQLRQRIDDLLQSIQKDLHPLIARIRFSFGDDWSGDRAIFFRIVLTDEASQRPDRFDIMSRIRDQVYDELDRIGSDHIPYFDVRSESEQEQLKSPEWA